jgi:hypothetical protein
MKSQKPKIVDMDIKSLVLDPTVQMRASLSRDAILDYAEADMRGEKFPPIVVFGRFGGKCYVADGFHRVKARIRNSRTTIKALLRDGSRRDAILYAAGCNQHHGVRRTSQDKQRAVITLLKDSAWSKWADTEIAKVAGVDHNMVGRYRRMFTDSAASPQEVRTYIDRAGKERKITVDNAMREQKQEEREKRMRADVCPYCGQRMGIRSSGTKETSEDRKARYAKEKARNSRH